MSNNKGKVMDNNRLNGNNEGRMKVRGFWEVFDFQNILQTIAFWSSDKDEFPYKIRFLRDKHIYTVVTRARRGGVLLTDYRFAGFG